MIHLKIKKPGQSPCPEKWLVDSGLVRIIITTIRHVLYVLPPGGNLSCMENQLLIEILKYKNTIIFGYLNQKFSTSSCLCQVEYCLVIVFNKNGFFLSKNIFVKLADSCVGPEWPNTAHFLAATKFSLKTPCLLTYVTGSGKKTRFIIYYLSVK